jgi:hypothetical protein
MKRLLHISMMLLLAIAVALSNSSAALADGEDGEHRLEMEVNGIHVSLANQHEWKKGGNTIVITLKDSSGFPVNNADVEIMIEPKAKDHAAAEESPEATDTTSAHGAEQGHSSIPGMEESATESHQMPGHDEGKDPLPSEELGKHGIYVVETHLESSGTHEIKVMFHVNGEMLQASFVVEIPGVLSKPVVLWSFVAINVVLVASADIMKKQSVPAKG